MGGVCVCVCGWSRERSRISHHVEFGGWMENLFLLCLEASPLPSFNGDSLSALCVVTQSIFCLTVYRFQRRPAASGCRRGDSQSDRPLT